MCIMYLNTGKHLIMCLFTFLACFTKQQQYCIMKLFSMKKLLITVEKLRLILILPGIIGFEGHVYIVLT